MDAGEVSAVLCALAGARRGDTVAVVGAPELAARAVLTAAGTAPVEQGARLAVAGEQEQDAREAAARLGPGGRLVALAPDAAVAGVRAGSAGLLLRHVVPLTQGVAWAATSPLDRAAHSPTT